VWARKKKREVGQKDEKEVMEGEEADSRGENKRHTFQLNRGT
jgi:hypothetical protein